MVGVFYFPQHLDPLVNVVWQKLRITFPAGSCTVVLRYCLAKFTSIRIWGMLFGKNRYYKLPNNIHLAAAPEIL